MAGLVMGQGGGVWMPVKASTAAEHVDWLFYFIGGISAFFFVLILALMVYFAWRYRHREGGPEHGPEGHSTALELTWTIIPTVIVIVIFYFGFRGYLTMAVVPPNAYEINVNASMWSWSFTYANGHVDNELHVPVNTPVHLILTSNDVIHSLFVPQFRLKKDAVPGRYNKFWFEATRTGTFDIYCAEYCGTKHSEMLSKVHVHEPEEFARWLNEASNWAARMAPADAGKLLYTRQGCFQCHSLEKGVVIQAPSFADLYGSQRPLRDGTRVLADENYIRRSILEPAAQVAAGFEAVMPSYAGRMKDADINAMIAFLKTISAYYTPAEPATRPATQPSSEVLPAP